eukprot:SAG11_NODE_23908_length_381_cov_1.042553_1_plen_50_part_01
MQLQLVTHSSCTAAGAERRPCLAADQNLRAMAPTLALFGPMKNADGSDAR